MTVDIARQLVFEFYEKNKISHNSTKPSDVLAGTGGMVSVNGILILFATTRKSFTHQSFGNGGRTDKKIFSTP